MPADNYVTIENGLVRLLSGYEMQAQENARVEAMKYYSPELPTYTPRFESGAAYDYRPAPVFEPPPLMRYEPLR